MRVFIGSNELDWDHLAEIPAGPVALIGSDLPFGVVPQHLLMTVVAVVAFFD